MLLRRKTIATFTDEELIDRLRADDRASLGLLWDRYAQLLFGVGLKYLKDREQSKDAVVDVFERLPRLVTAHAITHFRSWLHAVMRNHCLQVLRKNNHELHDDRTLERIEHEEGDDRALHEATLQELEHAMDQLNEEQRTCLRLFYLERLSYAQVQASTGFNYDQVRSHLQNGRRNLKTMLLNKTGTK